MQVRHRGSLHKPNDSGPINVYNRGSGKTPDPEGPTECIFVNYFFG
jgi:hypothetical protein